MSNDCTLNEYRKELKVKILQQASERFAKNGVRMIKMDDIAHSLGISKRTLYELYPNKEELLLECVKKQMNAVHEQLEGELGKDYNVMDVICHVYRIHIRRIVLLSPVVFEDLHLYPKVREFWAAHHEQKKKETMAFFKKGKEEGYFLADANFDIISHIGDLLNESIAKNRLYFKYAPEELFRHMVLMFIRSICTAKGIEELDRIMGTK